MDNDLFEKLLDQLPAEMRLPIEEALIAIQSRGNQFGWHLDSDDDFFMILDRLTLAVTVLTLNKLSSMNVGGAREARLESMLHHHLYHDGFGYGTPEKRMTDLGREFDAHKHGEIAKVVSAAMHRVTASMVAAIPETVSEVAQAFTAGLGTSNYLPEHHYDRQPKGDWASVNIDGNWNGDGFDVQIRITFGPEVNVSAELITELTDHCEWVVTSPSGQYVTSSNLISDGQDGFTWLDANITIQQSMEDDLRYKYTLQLKTIDS